MSDVFWKKKKVTSSDFSQFAIKTISLKEDKRKSPEDLNRVIGQDQITDYISVQREETKLAFQEKFGEEIPNEDAMKDMISDTYQRTKQKSVSKMEKGKRAKESKEKLSLRKHLMNEQQTLVDERKRRRGYIDTFITNDYFEVYDSVWTTDREKDALREWLVQEGTTTFDKDRLVSQNALLKKDEANRYGEIDRILTTVATADIDEFLDEDDGAFASNYAQKYEKLCRYASADVFLEKYEAYQNTKLLSNRKRSATALRTKIEFFKEMKEQYEDRIKMMSSPYYVLLRKADMKDYMEKGGEEKINAIQDEGFKNYVRQFVKTQSSPLAMGKKSKQEDYFYKLYEKWEKYQAPFEKEAAQKGLDILEKGKAERTRLGLKTEFVENDFHERMSANELSKSNQKVLDHFDDVRAYYLSSYPQNDMDFLQNVAFDVGANLINGFKSTELWDLEKNVIAKIYQEGVLRGQAIPEDVLNEIKPMIDELIGIRRTYLSKTQAADFTKNLVEESLQCDVKDNRIFAKSDVGKKLLKYETDEAAVFLDMIAAQEKGSYYLKLSEISVKLTEHGFSFSEDFDQKADQKADELIEQERLKKEEQANEGKEQHERWDYPAVTINGKSYRLFQFKQTEEFETLSDKSFQIGGEDGAELIRLMDEQELYSKRLFYGDSTQLDGLNELAAKGHRIAYPAKLSQISAKVNEILKKHPAPNDNNADA